MNKAILMGRLGEHPLTRNISEMSSVTTASLATSEKYTNKSGEKVENTDWHRLIIWNKQGTAFEQYLTKGSEVLIEGRIKNRSYDNKDGIKVYVTEIVVDKWEFTGGSKNENQSNTEPQNRQAAYNEANPPSAQTPEGFDDLPF